MKILIPQEQWQAMRLEVFSKVMDDVFNQGMVVSDKYTDEDVEIFMDGRIMVHAVEVYKSRYPEPVSPIVTYSGGYEFQHDVVFESVTEALFETVRKALIPINR